MLGAPGFLTSRIDFIALLLFELLTKTSLAHRASEQQNSLARAPGYRTLLSFVGCPCHSKARRFYAQAICQSESPLLSSPIMYSVFDLTNCQRTNPGLIQFSEVLFENKLHRSADQNTFCVMTSYIKLLASIRLKTS